MIQIICDMISLAPIDQCGASCILRLTLTQRLNLFILYYTRLFMTEILLSTSLNKDTQLEKIGTSIYFNPTTKDFYRLSFLPHGVVFRNNDVIQPKVCSLTKFDPYFLAINKLANGKAKIDALPHYLQHLDFSKIADIDESLGKPSFILNEAKVFDLLEAKVAKLHKCIDSNDLEKNTFKTEGGDHRYITAEILNILKSEITNHPMLDKFARDRYSYVPSRKHLPQEEEQPSNKFQGKNRSKPKKEHKKQEPKPAHNQKTLKAFFAPKPKKE